jgi:LuxR family transcriptional regulator, quorum-sensing system regulator CciR
MLVNVAFYAYGSMCNAALRRSQSMVMDMTLEFVREANQVDSEEKLSSLFEEATRALGFEQFTMGHHVDFDRRPADAIFITNYPDAWVREMFKLGLYREDPILIASTTTPVGFRWSDIDQMIELSERHVQILEKGRSYGLSDGFTVPVHIPGEYWGTCSFGALSMDAVRPNALQAAQLIGTFGFEAARRLRKAKGSMGRLEKMPVLTRRQIDCVTLIAQGKTDWEAAQILGLAQDTVHEHIETARKRYRVAKRTQLVVRALFDGQIPFSSVVV